MSEIQRYLVVNADDFGLTDGINRGIIEAHEDGIVTSASLMVRYPAAKRAAAYAREHSQLSVGLHFDIAEWCYRNGKWEAAYQVVDAADGAAVNAELNRQLDRFNELIGRLPTHLDSHQHVHRSEPARSILLNTSRTIHVPLRGLSDIRYEGSFYGQTGEGQPFAEGITASWLEERIAQLEAGWTEIGCHPGYPDGLDSVYRDERAKELRVLCSAEIRAAIKENEIRLVSFRDFRER